MFFDKVRITCILDYDSFVFISIICNVNLHPLRTFIGPMSRLFTPITLANPEFGVRIFFALCGCGGCCWWCRQGFWPSVELAVGQPPWNSTEFLCHLMALQLISDAWKVELYCEVCQSSWLCCGLYRRRTRREGSRVLKWGTLTHWCIWSLLFIRHG